MHPRAHLGVTSLLLVAAVAGCGSPTASVAPPSFAGSSQATHTAAATEVPAIIVRFRPGKRQLSGTLAAVRQVRSLTALDAAMFSLAPGADLKAALRSLAADPNVRYAQANARMHLDGRIATPAEIPAPQPAASGDPNDPLYGSQYGPRLARAPRAWARTRGEGILIAIADTGIDINHPDLAAKVLPGYATADSHPTLEPGYRDDHGHGTHCAGIAAAITNNGVGVAGMAPDAQLLPVKVCERSGMCWTSAVAEGITWATDHGAHVISLSLSSDDDNKTPQQLVIDAVNYALGKNVSVVVAMGNDGHEVRNIPAIVPGVIAVGATNSRDSLASFSTPGDWISVSAPGVGVLSTVPLDWSSSNAQGYASMSGTSMAAPHVAGLAALVRAANPTATQAEIKRLIETSADDKGTKGFDNGFGHGRINAARAVGLN